MSDFFIVRRGGGGGAGATLTVNAPNGVTAKLRQGDVIKTKSVANGSAVFPGLSGGQWLVSIYDATHAETTPQPVTVTTDYAVTLSFFSATINITYPAGSTCTVTSSNGAITLTAPDTSGVWICTVPEADIWTVTATDGVTTDSKQVIITTQGQTVSVTVDLFDGNLYDAGDYNVTFTALAAKGHSSGSGAAPTVAESGSNVTLSLSGTSKSGAWRSDAVDLTGFNTLNVDVSDRSTTGGKKLFVTQDTTCNLWNSAANTSAITDIDVTGKISLDVSGLDGEGYYIGIGLLNSSSVSSSSVTATRIWLE